MTRYLMERLAGLLARLRALGEPPAVQATEAETRRRRAVERYGPDLDRFADPELTWFLHIAETLEALPERPGVIYEIGASKGIWSESFALITGQPVYAFEPLSASIALLQERSRRCPLIRVQPVACGRVGETMDMHVDLGKVEASSILEMNRVCREEFSQSGVGVSRPEQIQTVRLDDWVAENKAPLPELIKIDVQGYENEVIAGATETLTQTRYVWIEVNFVALYEGGSTFHTVYEALAALGFRLRDVVGLNRSKLDKSLLYADAVFENLSPK